MRVPRLNRCLHLLVSTALLLALAGCGGGSSGDGAGAAAPETPSTTPSTTPATDPSTNPSTTPSSTLSVAQRSDSTSRLADRFRQITGGAEIATPEMWEQLRAWVMAQPEFVDAGVGDQLLWARFRDGRYFLYTDNWRSLPPQPAAAVRSELKSALLKQDVPASPDALLLSDSDAAFADVAPVLDHMTTALFRSGWTPTSERSLFIDKLRRPGELGFLFLSAHAGEFGPTGAKQFAMVTDDRVSIPKDFEYSSELEDGSLIYHRDRKGFERFGFEGNLRYAITARFVDRYLRFSPEALVILVACNSGSSGAGATAFRDAFRLRGAGTVVGWEGNTNPQAFPTMDLMVDRLTGMNAVQPVTPANRPFNFEDVWTYLGNKGLLQTPGPAPGDPATPVRRFGTDFHILQPIVSELEVTGVDRLVLHGDFGKQPATVTVGGSQFTATPSFDGKELKVDMGPDTHGEVVVTSRERKSNRRVLGSWKGQVTYRQTFDRSCAQEVFSNTVNVNLHLRADMHAIRYAVDGPLQNILRMVTPASNTTAAWSAQGSCSDEDGLQERWSGSGPIAITPFGDGAPTPSGSFVNLVIARIDALEGRFQLYTLFTSERVITVQTSDSTFKSPMIFDEHLSEFLNDGSTGALLPWGHFLRFDGSRNVAAGQFQKGDPRRPAQALTVQWASMPATPAYDAGVPR